MTELSLDPGNFLGLFEIDRTGRILYARIDGPGPKVPNEMTGRNFFELAPAQARLSLAEHVKGFVNSTQQAESFYFLYEVPGGTERVKVLLGRIRDRRDTEKDISVLVHLRRV